MTSSIASSISSALGMGSGIDTNSIVTQLVSATRAPRESVITTRQTTNSARISALASATSALDTFATSLADTLKSSSYAGQPVSNDPSIAAVSLKAGGVPAGLPAQIEVTQLATAQILESTNLASNSTAVGLGTLTLTTASGAHTITIDATNNNLDGLAKAINDAKAGVTAMVVTDKLGSRLVLKGDTGVANAFTLTPGTADADLQRFTFDGVTGGMTQAQSARDSIVKIDNVTMQNSGNVLENAIPYVRIDLNKAAPGTLVTLATDQPTKTTSDLVQEFVTAYNTLRSALNRATASGSDSTSAGALAGDAGARDMINQLSKLTTTVLSSTGTYQRLSDIGVSTNKDGTLKLDATRLAAVIAADPGAVAQMINPAVSTASSPGLAAAVSGLQTKLETTDGAVAMSKAKYDKLATDLSKQLDKLNSDMTDYQTRISATYTAMESQMTAFKATKAYLDQQIAIWNNTNSNK